jgi:hypothetical protein
LRGTAAMALAGQIALVVLEAVVMTGAALQVGR